MWLLWVEPLSHVLQWYGFSSVCILSWIIKLLLLVKPFLHVFVNVEFYNEGVLCSHLSKNVLAFLIVLASGLLNTSRTPFSSNITAQLCKKSQKISKNNILLGSHLNNLFLPNKNCCINSIVTTKMFSKNMVSLLYEF